MLTDELVTASMTDAERAAILEKGKKCRARGCKCLARCYRCWNKWWHMKADVCTHPNWLAPDTEWIENDPPLVGNKPRPQPPPKTRPTIEKLKLKSKQPHAN